MSTSGKVQLLGIGVLSLTSMVPLSVAQDREQQIRDLLAINGISINNTPPCTQVGGLLMSSVLELIEFHRVYVPDMILTVTAGNEAGNECHPLQKAHKYDLFTKNHRNGWKADLRIQNQVLPELDALSVRIETDLANIVPSSNRPQFQEPNGAIFALEYPLSSPNYVQPSDSSYPNHWDVLFYVDRIDAIINGQTNPTSALPLPMGQSIAVTALARDLLQHDIGLTATDFTWTSTDPSTATVDGRGTVTGIRQGSVGIFVAQGLDTFQIVAFDIQIPPPPPTQPGGTWVWDPTANGGTGAWVWQPNCSGSSCNPAPPGGGTPPAPGACPPLSSAGPCWIWDPNANGGNGAWIFVRPPGSGNDSTDTATETPVSSLDPNDLEGPNGVASGRSMAANQQFRYAIYFENQPSATAPAQTVTITDTLNANLDLSTVTLGPITFPNQVITPPAIPLYNSPFTTTVDLRPTTNLLVKINATLNTTTGLLTWTFQSLDPATNQPPADPLAGFLPPGAEGSVFFTVLPKSSIKTGTVIQNTATVVFDANPPINTPTWFNTIDNTKPTSHVNTLPATESTTSFTVSWAGSDDGAGVQDFTVYVSDNGGSFSPWQTNTPATSATFNGTVGHTYRFYSISRDLVGNVEAAKTTPEATTTVTNPPSIQCTGCYFLISGVRATLAFNIAVTGTTSTFTYNYRTSSQTVQFASTSTDQISVNGNTAMFSGQGKLNGVAGYSFTVTAKDGGAVGSGLDTVSITITGPNNYSYTVTNSTIVGGDIVVK